MKKTIVFFIITTLVIGGIWWWSSLNKVEDKMQAQTDTSNYQVERSNTNINNNTSNKTTVVKKEVEIANSSTKIYNKDKDRQNNISITCKTLTTKEVQPGEIFSFCDIVGKATHEKGYEEADIYVDGKKEQGLGGGNCQVSTTLYNAVLQVPELEVIERHEHSGHVPYVEKRKRCSSSIWSL